MRCTPAQPVSGRTGSPDAPQILFWLAFAVLGYVCVGYPILARVRAAINPRTRRRAPIEPSVTIIVAAHNEADRVDRRLRNLLALDYPTDHLEVVLGSDGSTDDTVSRARPFESAGVIVHEFAERRGKPALLNALVPRASGEIVVFADARQRFDPLAVRALVANFADPAVGAVSGELIMSATRRCRARGRRRGAVLELREIDPIDGKPRRIHGWRDRRDLCHSQGAVRASAGRHHSG